MNPIIWGKYGWFFLHSITLGYPSCPTKTEKTQFKNFFTNIGNVLPCDRCKINYKSHLKKFPLNDDILSSKIKLIHWLIDIHNSVNKINGKKVLTYEEAIGIYSEKYDETLIKKYNILIKISTSIFILLIIIFISYHIYNSNYRF